MPRAVSRGPINCTARRAVLPASQGTGRKPKRGARVRPLPRTYQPHPIAATPPDRQEPWQVGARKAPLRLPAECGAGLGRAEAQPGAPTFRTAVIHEPRSDEPWLLHTVLPLTGAHLQACYRDRWPVAGLP